MGIHEILKAAVAETKARDHEAVLRDLYSRLVPDAQKREETLSEMKEHESLEGVLSGTGAAIFHCLTENVQETAVAVAVSRRGVPGPVRKRPVRIFFLIVSPIKESGTHLQILSRIESLLLDRALRHALLSSGSEAQIREAIKKHESARRGLYVPLEVAEVMAELDTTPQGLSAAEAARRLKLAGPNRLKRIGKSPLLRDFLYNLFLNLFALLLWAGGVMAFVAGMPELGWAIFMVIVINAMFSFWQEYRAGRAVEALGRLLPRKVAVIRDGREAETDASLIVPGDVIRLSEGDSVPADGRLIEAEEMRVDNSALTGESRPVYKISGAVKNGRGFIWTEMPNMVFAGTTVVSGAGAAVVTATGMDTEIGRVAFLTQAIGPEESPLQREIGRITKAITAIAVSLGGVFFLLGYLIAGLTFAESFIFAIGIIVANVPEGLLPTVSLSLAMGVQRMAARKAIVKKLSAVETLGSATVICTDKTGTLTANQMLAVELFTFDAEASVHGSGYEPSGSFTSGANELTPQSPGFPTVRSLLSGAALCNNARLNKPGGGTSWTITGDPTEGALLTAAAKAGIDIEALKGDCPRIAHIPFERIRKRMTTVHEPGGVGERLGIPEGRAIAFVKGSAKEVVSLCARRLEGGTLEPLSEDGRRRIFEAHDLMASKGLRVLAVACRGVERRGRYEAAEVERDLAFIGLVALLDPPRPEVRKAVEDCHTAGIKIVMITGDYGLTARAVARQVGLDARKVISGEELASLSQRALEGLLKEEAEVIFARVAPADKLRVVEALQKNGEVVAVTGDGVNDAPALRKADIGIAMGLRGSDVAKESAEMVLADDNFASIVDAIREGRAVYANIKKFVTYIFASNIPEVIPFIAFILFKIPLPLTVLQILAVDLGTDVLPALALGVEPPEPGVMKEPPRPRGKRLLDLNTLLRAYLFLGPIEAALAMSAFFAAYVLRGWEPGTGLASTGPVYAAATTMTFAAIVASQVGNVFACRTDRSSVFAAGLFRNRFIISSILAEAAITLSLIYVPPLADIFGFHPLGLYDWAVLLTFPPILLGAEEARKALMRRRTSR